MKPVCHDRYSSWVLGIIFWPKMLVLTHFLTFQRCSSDGGNAEAPSVDSGVDGIAVLALLMCWWCSALSWILGMTIDNEGKHSSCGVSASAMPINSLEISSESPSTFLACTANEPERPKKLFASPSRPPGVNMTFPSFSSKIPKLQPLNSSLCTMNDDIPMRQSRESAKDRNATSSLFLAKASSAAS